MEERVRSSKVVQIEGIFVRGRPISFKRGNGPFDEGEVCVSRVVNDEEGSGRNGSPTGLVGRLAGRGCRRGCWGGWPRLHGYFEPVRNGFKSFSKSFSNVAILQAGPAFACSMAFRSDALSRFDEMIFQEI